MSRQAITPRWLTYAGAASYSSFSTRKLEELVAKKLIVSHNVRDPGKNRGRRLIDRESLDAFIESSGDEPSEIAMNTRSRTIRKKGAKP